MLKCLSVKMSLFEKMLYDKMLNVKMLNVKMLNVKMLMLENCCYMWIYVVQMKRWNNIFCIMCVEDKIFDRRRKNIS